jgi:flagellin-like hook-associated protein FlgL
MSTDYDADIATTASQLSAEQLAYQASLMAIAQISQYSLFNYL